MYEIFVEKKLIKPVKNGVSGETKLSSILIDTDPCQKIDVPVLKRRNSLWNVF